MNLIKLGKEKLGQVSGGVVAELKNEHWHVEKNGHCFGGWIEGAKDGWIIIDNEEHDCDVTVFGIEDRDNALKFDQLYHNLGDTYATRQENFNVLKKGLFSLFVSDLEFFISVYKQSY